MICSGGRGSLIKRDVCLALVVALPLMAGCAINETRTSGGQRQFADAAIRPGEAVAVVLKSHANMETEEAITEGSQRALESCVKDGMYVVNRQLELTDATHPSARYRIEVHVATTRSEWDPDVLIPSGPVPSLPGVGVHSVQTTELSGFVFDARAGGVVATLRASAVGRIERAVGFVFIIPIPLAFSARTEYNACRRFGQELAKLVHYGELGEAAKGQAGTVTPPKDYPTNPPQPVIGGPGHRPVSHEYRPLGRLESKPPLRGGSLYLAVHTFRQLTKDQGAAWLVLNFDAGTERGEKSLVADATADCASGSVSLNWWTTFAEQNGNGDAIDSGATGAAVDALNESLRVAAAAICGIGAAS